MCDNKKCNDNFITFELGRPEQQFRKALCFSRDVFFNSPQDLRAASADRHETLSLDWYLAEFYNARPKIRGPPPKKNLGLKHAFWVYFTQHPTLIANISGTSQYIQIRN